jgi:hypothetical protein
MLHHQRGDAVCENSLLVRRDDLESRLLRRLSEAVLREEVIDYAIAGLREEIPKRHESLNAELAGLREEKRRIESELAHLVEVIALGKGSSTVMAAITEREERIKAITNRVIEPGPDSLQEKLAALRTFAVARLTDLRKLIAHPGERRAGALRARGTLWTVCAGTDWRSRIAELCSSRRNRFLQGRYGANGWCRGPESERTSAGPI